MIEIKTRSGNLLRTVDAPDLCGAELRDADLRSAALYGAELRDAILYGAYLRGAILYGADLRGADLRYTDLRNVALCGAKVKGVQWPAPTMVLLARWGRVSDDLTRDLMAFDAWCHPDPEAFDRWAADDDDQCPYNGVDVQRTANFSERKDLWTTGTKIPQSPLALMRRLLEECCDGD